MPIDRRTAMRGRTGRGAAAAFLASVGVATTACATSGSGGATAADGVLTYATNGIVQCLDPQAAASKLTAVIDRNLFDSLVAVSGDGEVRPWLAERWTVSKDGRTYTFTLRQGVVFHDGTPLTADAVKATLDHAVDPRTRSLYASSLLGAYAGTRVVDDRTVEIRLSRPHSPLLESLSTPYLGIQSARALRDKTAGPCTKPVGSGPFKFASWTKGSSISLTKNPAYRWAPQGSANPGPAHLAGVTFRLVPEDTARYGALTSGQAHLIDDVPAANVTALQRSKEHRYLRRDVPGAVLNIMFNATRAPLDDERVRRALRQSIDLDQLVKSIYAGQYARAWSPLSPATPGYDPKVAGSWRYDPATAGRLLDEAGWTGRDSAGYRTRAGRRLTVRWPVGSRLIRRKDALLAQGIQADAKKAGIEIQYIPEDTGAFIRDVTTRNLDFYFEDFRTSSPDVLRYLYGSDQFPARGGSNVFHLRDARLDGWLQRAVATTDRAAQRDAYQAAQRHLVERAYVLPIYVPAELLGMSRKVRGLGFDPSVYLLFHDARLDGS
ncbi:MAG TPA: ABC transporter substrate-binding protein [Thermomonospora sp.]|nr:ABC transporter substrate-binding protein [Thermomonospora sp.]